MLADTLGGPALPTMSMIIIVTLLIVGMVLWLWALIDCLAGSRETNEKILWALVLLFTGWIGVIIYFAIAKKPSTRLRRARVRNRRRAAGQSPESTNPVEVPPGWE